MLLFRPMSRAKRGSLGEMTKRSGLSLRTERLTETILSRRCSIRKVHQVFGTERNRIIEELNGALAA